MDTPGFDLALSTTGAILTIAFAYVVTTGMTDPYSHLILLLTIPFKSELNIPGILAFIHRTHSYTFL